MIKLIDLFHIEYGTQLDLNKQYIEEDGVNFVNRSSKNLGVSCQIRRLESVLPFEKGLITIALGGSILETYIQPKNFYTGQNVKILIPRKALTYKQKMFYCLCIKKKCLQILCFWKRSKQNFK